MKKFLVISFALSLFTFACKSTGTMASIQPKAGEIELPANGELRMWKDIEHPSFSVTFSNPNEKQSCEIYKVKNGNEDWVSPSLIAGKSLTVTVPANGHIFFKNFNPNVLKITYKIDE
jgi:hypothetical protein